MAKAKSRGFVRVSFMGGVESGRSLGRAVSLLMAGALCTAFGCSSGEAPPKAAGEPPPSATCALDEVREFYCDGLLPMSTALGAPPPYEACPAGIESPEGAYPRRENVARFDATYTAWVRTRAQPGHSCCYSWCAKLAVADPDDVLPSAGCDQAGVMREDYCFPELESGTSQPGPAGLERCPLAIRPPPTRSFSVPKAAPLALQETSVKRQRNEPVCCYGWCSYVPASAR